MGEYSFLEEAVILQITRLLQVVQHANGIPNFIANGANSELDKFVEFTYKNNFPMM